MSIYAIDLGNSRMKCAKVEADGRAVVIPNALGELATPSVIYFPDGDDPVVGSEALNMAMLEPEQVVRNWKRHMGADTVLYEAPGGRHYRAQDIAALLLSDAKKSIETRTGEVVKEVTITVPANYTEQQKALTIEAAEHVGMTVLCLPTEPVAAAFGNEIHKRGDGISLVFDLGGGTFDVSLIQVSGNLLKVLCTNGDPELGSQDVNARIRQKALEMFEAEQGEIPDLNQAAVFYADLEARIEQLKTTLTTRESGNLILRDGHKLLNRKITRQELEEWINDLIQRALAIVNQTLDEVQVKWDQVSVILAVGGGSRLPMVARELERLSSKRLSQKVEPDYAAVLGAVTAARIEMARQGRPAQGSAGALPPINFFAREVTSHPLGVSALNDQTESVQHVLLPKGTPYPSTQVRRFALAEAHQTAAKIVVLEGENEREEGDCTRLGEFQLENLPPYPDITERIEITFELNPSGLLTATAQDLKGGQLADMKLQYKSQNSNGKDNS